MFHSQISTRAFCRLIFTLVFSSLTSPALAFYGGEEVPNGNPWHHYDITRRAAAGDYCFLDPIVYTGRVSAPARCVSQGNSASRDQATNKIYLAHAPGGDQYAPGIIKPLYRGAGFSRDAALALAWHADWVDSYLYNPLWWASAFDGKGGAVKRAIVSAATYEDLAKVHFDDSFSIDEINDDWTRYSAGTVIGLNFYASEWGEIQREIISLNGQIATASNPSLKASLQLKLLEAQGRERETLQAGFNIIGVSMHALEDFYSHSTWMNYPQRRRTTWLEMAPNVRTNRLTMAGAYEKPASSAPVFHGDYAFACSLLNRKAVSAVLKPACSALSPAQNMKVCKMRRQCDGAQKVDIRTFGEQFGNLIYLNPVGINLDNTIFARLGGHKRGILTEAGRFAPGQAVGLIDRQYCPSIINRKKKGPGARIDCVTGPQADARLLFATSKDLAIRAVTEWLLLLEKEMANTGNSAYWNALKNYRNTMPHEQKARERQYENYARFPYMFLTAGPYPGSARESSSGYYLRLDITTSNQKLSGTDADIYAIVNGEEFPLDYMPTQYDEETGEGRVTALQRAFSYNDFEKGKHTIYMVGPFKTMPRTIRLENRATKAKKIMKALGKELKDGFKRVGFKLRDAALTIIGGHADFVDTQIDYWDRDELDQIIATGGHRLLTFDGGKEGLFTFDILVERTSWAGQGYYEDWKQYRISIKRMNCIKESKNDRGSNSDEIFSLWTLSLLSEDSKQSHRTRVYNDVDRGEYRDINYSFNVVNIPPLGGVVLAGQVWESDSESGGDRNRLMVEFATGVEQKVAPRRGRFLSALGSSIAAEWKPGRIQIVAFRRGPRPELGVVYEQNTHQWVTRKRSLTLNLSGGLRPLRSSPPLVQWTGASVAIYDNPTGLQDKLKDKVPPVLQNQPIKIPAIPAGGG